MKINREMVVRAGLKLLNEVGLEQLTLRRLAVELKVQAATLYWHFESKEALLDEMATSVLADGAPNLVGRRAGDWKQVTTGFGRGLRKTLLGYRDGARMVSGTRLTNTVYMETVEGIGARVIEAGFTLRQGVVLMSTIYSYTVSFVMEEQAVYPAPGERAPEYDLASRRARLDEKKLPILRRSGGILLEGFERRYQEGLELILSGAELQLQAGQKG